MNEPNLHYHTNVMLTACEDSSEGVFLGKVSHLESTAHVIFPVYHCDNQHRRNLKRPKSGIILCITPRLC